MPTKKQQVLPSELQEPLDRLRQTVGHLAPEFLTGITSWVIKEYKKRPYRWMTPISFSNREVRLIAAIAVWTRRSQAKALIEDGCQWDRQRNLPTQENLCTLLQEELQEARDWAKMRNKPHKASEPDPQIEMIMEFPDMLHILAAMLLESEDVNEAHMPIRADGVTALQDLLTIQSFLGDCRPEEILAGYIVKYALVRMLAWSFKDHYLEALMFKRACKWAYPHQTLEGLLKELTVSMVTTMRSIVELKTHLDPDGATNRVRAHVEALFRAMET